MLLRRIRKTCARRTVGRKPPTWYYQLHSIEHLKADTQLGKKNTPLFTIYTGHYPRPDESGSPIRNLLYKKVKNASALLLEERDDTHCA
jgi:hypothetical protein